jgi:beta-glucosidase
VLAGGAAAATPAQRAEGLLRKMTLDEKIGQLVLLTGYGATTGPAQAQQALDENIRSGNCGSVLNVISVAQIQRLQKMAVEETRLRIPVLFGYDVIHGYQTIFPISLGEAASWDLEAIERSARVAAIEASAAGLNWTYAPMVDIARDPRWGRISEGAGEDPFLGAKIARARVRGFQGKNLDAPDTLLACVKHFAAYGAALAGRDYNTVDMSERLLREVHLPPYEAAIQEGALSVMTSFNELDGTPASANSFLLQKILRQEWRFKGFVVSDYTSINEMVAHGSAADDMDAAKQAFNAGVDMDMVGPLYLRHLKALVARGEVKTSRINSSAKRILEAKFRLGLFDDPFRYCDAQREARLLGAKEHLEAAYRMACDSLVLLKNESRTLPLKPGSKIAVIGPLADSQRDLLGSWKAEGRHEGVETVLSSIKRNNTGGETMYSRGCDIASPDRSGFEPAVAAASRADVVILLLGESWDMTGEACCRTSINLPGVQTELLRQVSKTGKPLILLLMNGRPLALEEETTLVDAMLEAWLPGSEGGRAVADVLFGKHNPSGKLPVTFPRNLGQVPIFYSAKNTGRPIDPANPKGAYRSFYLDSPNDPLFPFGYGLSYSTFTFSDLQLDRAAIKPGQQITVSVNVSNKGDTEGAEVVQLYVRDLVGSVTRPVLELKGFQKIRLKAGESRKVNFVLGEADLRFLRKDMTWGAEPGQFLALVGPNSRDLLTAKFELLKK